MKCKCGVWGHDSRLLCIEAKHCECCDLEDEFVLLAQQGVKPPQSEWLGGELTKHSH